MYEVYAGDICIYNDKFLLESTTVIDPKLTMEINSAGSFTVTLPPANAGYESIEKMSTEIRVLQNKEIIWTGRVLSEKIDFWNRRTLTCEGALAYFNDSVQPFAEHTSVKVDTYLRTLIANHNSQVSDNKKFTIGTIDAIEDEEAYTRVTNYQTTKECMDDIVNTYGGMYVITYTYSNNSLTKTISYKYDYTTTSSQTISFGTNLLDYTQNYDLSALCTVIVPLGKALSESSIEGESEYLTVASVNGGSVYVESAEAIETYGRIIKKVEWSSIEDANTLLSYAKKYLSESQFDSMTLSLTALDMIYLGANYNPLRLAELVKVVSEPHGMNLEFPVTKIEIQLNSPESSKYTLNYESKSKISDSVASNTAASDKNKKSSSSSSKSYISKVERVSDTNYLITATKGKGSTESVTNNWNVTYDEVGALWTNSLNGQKIRFSGW